MSYSQAGWPENLFALGMDQARSAFGRRGSSGRCALLALLGGLFAIAPTSGEDWPAWRGPCGDGTSSETAVPTRWNGEMGLNLAWKVAVPGSGHASPIIWGNRVFLVACDEESKQ